MSILSSDDVCSLFLHFIHWVRLRAQGLDWIELLHFMYISFFLHPLASESLFFWWSHLMKSIREEMRTMHNLSSSASCSSLTSFNPPSPWCDAGKTLDFVELCTMISVEWWWGDNSLKTDTEHALSSIISSTTQTLYSPSGVTNALLFERMISEDSSCVNYYVPHTSYFKFWTIPSLTTFICGYGLRLISKS